MKIDHIALQVGNPREAANWYCSNYGAKLLYVDDTWSFVQFENVKLAFVIKKQHPAHIAFESKDIEDGKLHRDGSISVYKKDPWGNIFELIDYSKD